MLLRLQLGRPARRDGHWELRAARGRHLPPVVRAGPPNTACGVNCSVRSTIPPPVPLYLPRLPAPPLPAPAHVAAPGDSPTVAPLPPAAAAGGQVYREPVAGRRRQARHRRARPGRPRCRTARPAPHGRTVLPQFRLLFSFLLLLVVVVAVMVVAVMVVVVLLLLLLLLLPGPLGTGTARGGTAAGREARGRRRGCRLRRCRGN